MMVEIAYVVGDATRPVGSGPRVIVHICNDVGRWGAGFVLALSKRWTEPKQRYRDWYLGWHTGQDPPFALGQVQFVSVESGLCVANLIGQDGIGHRDGQPPIRYEAVRTGLARVAEFALERGASVHMPRIGAGLAGGDWQVIEVIITDELIGRSVPVTVYDLPRDPD